MVFDRARMLTASKTKVFIGSDQILAQVWMCVSEDTGSKGFVSAARKPTTALRVVGDTTLYIDDAYPWLCGRAPDLFGSDFIYVSAGRFW